MRKLALLLFLVACQPAPAQIISASAEPTTEVVVVMQTPLPTHTPRPLFASPTPLLPTLQPTATVTPELFDTATPIPAVVSAAQSADHFVLDWPVSAYSLNRVYAYGGTDGGRLQVHHGIDLVNPIGTPIQAAADGTVVYAGDDLTTRFGPDTNFYGNLVVIQHNFLSPEGLPVFTLYGHMLQVTVRSGQTVQDGTVIGLVGQTGIALGPHLHFEVRVGSAFDYGATRNPELWLRPLPNLGVLAGRVIDADGLLVNDLTLTIQSTASIYHAYTYGDASVYSDPTLGENFTIGSLPADTYAIAVIQDGRIRFARTVAVTANQLNWIDVQLAP